MQRKPSFHTASTREKLTEQLVEVITSHLMDGINSHGKASLAVSGGSTPVELFKKLSTAAIPWAQVFISLVDERWVNPDSQDSNEKLVKTYLLQNNAAAAQFRGMKNSAASASEGALEYEKHLKKIPQPFDVVLLGLGTDGHTASLFPNADQLAMATDMQSGMQCIAITPTTAPHERMSLTLPAILSSRQIILHITGYEKRDVMEKAMEDGPKDTLPIRYILIQDSTPFDIYWAE